VSGTSDEDMRAAARHDSFAALVAMLEDLGETWGIDEQGAWMLGYEAGQARTAQQTWVREARDTAFAWRMEFEQRCQKAGGTMREDGSCFRADWEGDYGTSGRGTGDA
jgi:hypothetical protein